jgi:hypothetical protein
MNWVPWPGSTREKLFWPTRVLRWFGVDTYFEGIEGDLNENFEDRQEEGGKSYACRLHWREAYFLIFKLALRGVRTSLPVRVLSRTPHYPVIYLLLALSILLPTAGVFRDYVAFVLALAVLFGLVLGVLIATGKIRPDDFWGRAGGNFMLAFLSTLCLGNLFIKELTLQQWEYAYGFTLGCMQVFLIRWLWPQLFDPDSEWAKKQRELTTIRIPHKSSGSDDDPLSLA